MHLSNYLDLVSRSEADLAEALDQVREHHEAEPDVTATCKLLASWSRQHVEDLAPFIARYGDHPEGEPKALHHDLFKGPRSGGMGLMRDLQDLYLMATVASVSWSVLDQAAKGLRDEALEKSCARMSKNTKRQMEWLLGRINMAAPQALIAAK